MAVGGCHLVFQINKKVFVCDIINGFKQFCLPQTMYLATDSCQYNLKNTESSAMVSSIMSFAQKYKVLLPD